MSLTPAPGRAWFAGTVNDRRTPGDTLARPLAIGLGWASVLVVLVSGITYVAWVLAVRGDWPAEGEVPDGFAGVVHHIWTLVDVASERGLPTWFNATLWLVLGALALAAAWLGRRRAGWVAFGVIALAAGVDETISVHERLQAIGGPIAQALGLGVVYAWVIPGLLLAAAVAALLWPLVRVLPSATRRLIVLGGVVFLLGAVVLETISGQLVGHFGVITWQNMLVTHVEELFEKLGLVLAIAGVGCLFSVRRSGGAAATLTFDDPFAAPRT